MFFDDDEFDRLFRQMSRAAGIGSQSEESEERSEPYYYGYTMTIGPDGRRSVKEFGNVRPGLQSKNNAEPFVETIADDKQEYVKMVAEMPGVEKSDIKIRVEGRQVRIDAERGKKKFHTTVPIKHKVDTSTAKANYKNGILELTFKRLEPEEPKGRIVEVD